MTIITTERLNSAQGLVTKLMEQGQLLYEDIAETAKDRARLSKELEERDGVINRLTQELQETRARMRAFEDGNNKLLEDATRMDSLLADAHARLDAISKTARHGTPAAKGDGHDAAGKAGVAALQRLTASRASNHGGPTS